MRRVFAPLRVLLLVLHFVDGLLITGLVFPWLAQPTRNRVIAAWSRGLLHVCGARLRLAGLARAPRRARPGALPAQPGRLLLANHVSWIDVFAILGAIPSRFVAKSEIGGWPLVGWLVTLVGTLYIERGRRHAVAAMNHRVRDRLRAGETVAVFPEGTTTDGFALLPFHSNLIAPALEVGCEIWPVALRYLEQGRPSRAAAFAGEMALLNSLWNILTARALQIEVAFLPPVPAVAGATRHHLAAVARTEIARQLGFAELESHLPWRAAAATANAPADKEPGRSSAAANASQ
jgi:1-acyl-sn-glycerol-3-phosphate acyltransferase